MQRRHFSDAARRRILRYYAKNGHTATLEKFGIVNSMLARWKAKYGVDDAKPEKRAKANGHDRDERSLTRLAKHLDNALTIRLRQTGRIEDLELYASLIVKRILGSDDG